MTQNNYFEKLEIASRRPGVYSEFNAEFYAFSRIFCYSYAKLWEQQGGQ